MESKFKKGDKARIAKYGSMMWQRISEYPTTTFKVMSQKGDIRWVDTDADIVGIEVEIVGSYSDIHCKGNGDDHQKTIYSVIPPRASMKCAWYNEEQLEPIP